MRINIEKEVNNFINSYFRKLTDAVDHMIRSTRAYSENRLADPYYSSDACSGLSFMPMALRDSRANTPARGLSTLRYFNFKTKML